MDSVTGKGAVQKEEVMAPHPQQVHCRELKSHKVHPLEFLALHVIYIT